jgi:hypothetical protein
MIRHFQFQPRLTREDLLHCENIEKEEREEDNKLVRSSVNFPIKFKTKITTCCHEVELGLYVDSHEVISFL